MPSTTSCETSLLASGSTGPPRRRSAFTRTAVDRIRRTRKSAYTVVPGAIGPVSQSQCPGPDALNVAAAPATITVGDPVALTATINDTRFNNSNGSEPTQAIAAAEYYIDTPPWQPGAVAHAMAAADGSFNSTVEGVTATVNTSGLGTGRHLIFVRGKDAGNNWGAFSAVFLDIEVLSVTPQAAAICTPANAQFTVNVGYSGAVNLSAAGHPASSM